MEANLSIHDWNECVCVFFIVICPVKVIFPERLNIYSVPQISFLDVFVGFSHHICEVCHIFLSMQKFTLHMFSWNSVEKQTFGILCKEFNWKTFILFFNRFDTQGSVIVHKKSEWFVSRMVAALKVVQKLHLLHLERICS